MSILLSFPNIVQHRLHVCCQDKLGGAANLWEPGLITTESGNKWANNKMCSRKRELSDIAISLFHKKIFWTASLL